MFKNNVFLGICLGFISGIGSASFLSVPFFIYPSLIFLILIVWFFVKKKFLIKNAWLIVFICLFFVLGIWRYQISFPKINENHISFYNRQRTVFEGEVVKEPDIRSDEVKLTLGKIKMREKELKGNVLVNVLPYSRYQRGDVLEVECYLEEPGKIDRFNYHEYLSKYNIYSTCSWPQVKILKEREKIKVYDRILILKNKAKKLIDEHFTEPQGAFISAFLLGFKKQIPSEVRNWFAQAGIAHVLAISGLHISIFSQLIIIFFTSVLLIRRQKSFWPTVSIIVLFVILAGAPASAIRAAIMGLGLGWTQRIGRPQAGKRIILYAATVMLFFNPKLLKADIGFQLSFLAVLGISFLSPFLNQFFKKLPDFKYFPLRQYLATSLSAQIFVLPLILYYFGNLSLISPLTNILVLSIMPLIMALGLMFVLFGLVHFYLAKVFFYPLWLLLTFVVLSAKIGAGIPGLSYKMANFPLFLTIILYLLIIFWLIKIKKNNVQEI